MTSEWIMSEGGPLIVMDRRLQHQWGGIFRLTLPVADAKHDYDRACRLRGYLEKIPTAGGDSLLLGDVPMDSCFWKSASSELCLISVLFCEPTFDVECAMGAFNADVDRRSELQTVDFDLFGDSLIMFDSADAGDEPLKFVSIDQETGVYTITTYSYHPDSDTSLVIHRFDHKD